MDVEKKLVILNLFFGCVDSNQVLAAAQQYATTIVGSFLARRRTSIENDGHGNIIVHLLLATVLRLAVAVPNSTGAGQSISSRIWINTIAAIHRLLRRLPSPSGRLFKCTF